MTSKETAAWHTDAELLDAYATGRLTPSRVMAVDAHLRACALCRAAVPTDMAWLERNWGQVTDVLQAARQSRVERALGSVGLPEHRVRLLAATPALRWSWVLATAAVLGFGVAAAYTGQAGARTTLLLFLVFAPVLPVLAVATAYGPPADPMHEITSATPMAGPSLVLWRATAVVGVSMAMGAVAALLLPGPGWLAGAWLLPAFLLCVSTLALATALPLAAAAGVFGGLWLIVVGGVAIAGSPVQTLFFGPVTQAGYLAAALLATAVLAVRHRRLDPGETR
ncbi:zf-HC2 domain-containing protein [Couchioplanes caeruleus]|uniref:anti-sigma factor family protein n=1 Tax=Couchioplanes caeruleus TaxID=56438 RepID=UPI0020C0F09C|nr:zf-HC2 domain-containing protein [Couchioplanes caeruleus]UQU64952.1 zf-HC2 domain-containing protein [Couchioplanes caeruleus]